MEDKSTAIVRYLQERGFQVAITPDKMVFKKGTKITFDLPNKNLSILRGFIIKKNKNISFDEMMNFELNTNERYADATPFEDGHKEFLYSVKLNLKNGNKIRLFEFVDRNHDGEDFLAELMDVLQRTINKA